MIVQDAQVRCRHRDIPLDTLRHLRPPLHAGPSLEPTRAATVYRTEAGTGFTTGVPWLDSTFGGLRPGRAYMILSAGGEAVAVARALVTTAAALSGGGSIIDPTCVMRHVVPEGVPSPWSVLRPATGLALTTIEMDTAPGPGVRLFVVVGPSGMTEGRPRRERAAVRAWLRRLVTAVAARGAILLIAEPGTSRRDPKALAEVSGVAHERIRIETRPCGSAVALHLESGRRFTLDACLEKRAGPGEGPAMRPGPALH